MLEVVEAAERSTEVVERQPATELLEAACEVTCPLQVGHGHRFGQLKDQQLPGKAAAGETGLQKGDELVALQ